MKLAGFLENYGKFTERYGHLLHHPIFTVKKSKVIVKGLTYRKVNAWDREGLILSSREKLDTGWRKFSIIDTVKISIISDLRDMGFPTKRIKIVIEKFTDGNISLWNPKKKRVLRLIRLRLEDFVVACLFDVRMFLVIRENEETFFLSETGAKSFCSHSDNEFSPVIRLPFYSYVKKTADVMKNEMGLEKNSTVEELLSSMLPHQEKRISRWIQSRNYEEMLFSKSPFKETRIKSGSRKDKKFSDKDILEAISRGDYYGIVITTRRKQKVKIVRKEWMARIKTQKGTPRLNM